MSAPVSSACSGPRRSASTIWCGCRSRRRRSCAPCCWNSKSPAAWSGTAAGSSRWCKLRAMILRALAIVAFVMCLASPRRLNCSEPHSLQFDSSSLICGRTRRPRAFRAEPSSGLRRRNARPARDRDHQEAAGIQQAGRLYVNQIASPANAKQDCRRKRSGARPSTPSRRNTRSSAGSSWRSGAWRPPTAR